MLHVVKQLSKGTWLSQEEHFIERKGNAIFIDMKKINIVTEFCIIWPNLLHKLILGMNLWSLARDQQSDVG